MKRLRKFLDLPPTERRLLVRATLLLGAIRLGLGLLPFQTFRRLLTHVTYAPIGLLNAERPSADRVAWAVTVAGRYMLGARACLTKALAVQVLLARHGQQAHLRLGVVRGEEGCLEAHAWVESDGRVVIGGSESELERYTPLTALDGDRL